MEKTHIKALDVAKGIAIIFVVLSHILGQTDIGQMTLVTTFFVIAGITYSWKADKKAFYCQKAKRILVPFWVFSLISIVIYWLMADVISIEGDTRIWSNILGMLYGNANTNYMDWNRPLWFLPALFSTIVLMDAAESLLRRLKPERETLCRLLFLAVAGCLGVILNVLKISLPLHIESAVLMVGFVELGYFLKLLIDRCGLERLNTFCCSPYGVILGGVAFAIMISSGEINGRVVLMTHNLGKYPPLVIITALAEVCAVLVASVWLRNSKLLRHIGVSSMSILLMHKFPLLFFRKIVPGFKDVLAAEGGIMLISCGIFVAIISIALCLIADWILLRLCPVIIGRTKEKRF